MAKYIIRLDDACPTMNHVNWDRMEKLLDEHGVKPIVGVIPCNKDELFSWPEDGHFWEHVAEWKAKGWTIAQHGTTHRMHPPKFENGGGLLPTITQHSNGAGRPAIGHAAGASGKRISGNAFTRCAANSIFCSGPHL